MNAASRRSIRFTALVVALLVILGPPVGGHYASVAAQDRSARTLDVYLIDVEGGNATLFVSPSRESVLIDTGNGGPGAVRDADRMMAAVKDAGLSQIDHLITTHYHSDHFGAMAELAGRIPIRESRKGGQPDAMKVLFSAPRLEAIWQLHFSQLSGQEYTVPGTFIANGVDDQPATLPIAPMLPPARGSGAAPPPVHNGPAYWIKVSARQDGSFTVTNARNGFAKTYAAR